VGCDLSLPDGPAALYDELAARGVHVDILINNAGTGDSSPYHEADWEFHERYIQLMALSPARLIHLLLPGMLERGYGHVVNVTSVAAHMPGIPMHGFYCPTKSFVYKLTETLATEFHGTGVTFTATAPGFTESEMIDSSGARPIVERLPGFMFSDTQLIAEQTVAACLAGVGTYTHTWFNRLFFGGFLRHFPTRYAHKLMLSERDRAIRQHAGDQDATSGLPGLPSARRRKATVG
jgi:short-subunit dehydrogenase